MQGENFAPLECSVQIDTFGKECIIGSKYLFYYRNSILEVCWNNRSHSSLTKENNNDLERVQKTAVRIMLRKLRQDDCTWFRILSKASLAAMVRSEVNFYL